ncbi:hypothetical protein Tco_1167809 [Tanacetum coccineum]
MFEQKPWMMFVASNCYAIVHKEVGLCLKCILTNRQRVESKAMLILDSRNLCGSSGFTLISLIGDHSGKFRYVASKYPPLVNIMVLRLSNEVDRLMWRNLANVDSDFSVAKVWEHLKHFSGISNIPSELNSIVDFLIPSAKLRSARSVIAKLIFAASCYFIWQERNERLFRKKKRSHDQVIDVIKSNVSLKLLTCRFQKMSHVQTLFHLWKFLMSLMDYS